MWFSDATHDQRNVNSLPSINGKEPSPEASPALQQDRRAGYGLEIPCVYRLYGPKAYVDKMKVITDSMMSSGLI